MRIRAEWNQLRAVIMHRPGVEIEYAMLAPKPFLFERSFRTSRAVEEHIGLERTLHDNGVKVSILKDEIVRRANDSSEFRRGLEERVEQNAMFYGEIAHTELARKDFFRNIHGLDAENLFHFLTLEPSVDLKKTESLQYPTIYSNIPLANLYFMRDQQIVSSDGVVIGSMRSLQRRKETEITDFFFSQVFGNGAVKRVSEGFLEGGDYMPAGDFAMFGIGPRTDLAGVMSALNTGNVVFDEYCIVENPVYEFMEGTTRDPMINMHLDTYFNLAGEGLAVGSISLLSRAKATIYARNGSSVEKISETTFLDYLKTKGYNIIDLSIKEQLSYSSNFLTISDRKIVAVNSSEVLKRLVSSGVFSDGVLNAMRSDSTDEKNAFPNGKRARDYGLDVIQVDLSELTGGYGGAHCMTAAVKRG
ncbi:MAG: arginine deiminase family protein [Thermoplasmataceae archaeon]